MRHCLLAMLIATLPVCGFAQDAPAQLYAPPALIETGLLKYILPRFTLKTQTRIALADTADGADIVLGDTGKALFQGPQQTWHMALAKDPHGGAERFAEWLTSTVGQNTILAYAPDGDPLFAPPTKIKAVVAEVEMTGDAILGLDVSRKKCARCHTVDPKSRMSNIGSTPSFYVLRSLSDWEGRFAAFYVLRPHGAFTQIEDVTEPFDISRPSPIAPVTMTLDEVEAVLAYVAGLVPADLGDPLKHQ